MKRETCLVYLFAILTCLEQFRAEYLLRTSTHKITPAIVHGDPIEYDEFPFMAALGWENNATGRVDYLGGGMLITPNLVLTAAHCVFFKGRLPDVVAIGGNPLNNHQNQAYKVKNYYLQPEYDDKLAYHDIAIFKLDGSAKKPPVCLWNKPVLHSPNVTAIGFGATQFAGQRSMELLKVKLLVYSEALCKPFFKRQRKFPLGLLKSHLCAGDPEKRRDTCQGDSGGPLISMYRGRKYAVGITSTGQACSGFPPAIYTRISSYLPWIEEKAKEHGHSIRDDCEKPYIEHPLITMPDDPGSALLNV